MKNEVIVLENVWKTYQMDSVKVDAVRGISFSIGVGEFVSIMGPSGSGKSTLMDLMGCLDNPTHGKILLKGKDISKMSEETLAQMRGKEIGFVFQTFNLIPTLTALENVMLPTLFQPENKGKENEAKKILGIVGLGERLNHLPSQLSGGERQRVAVARALINDPSIILADEPTGNLDSETGKEIMDLFEKLHSKEKKTVIVVTHDPYVAGHAHRKIQIIDGQIAHDHKLAKRFMWK